MKNILRDNEKRISLLLFIITMAVAVSPLISRYCINGHDLEYHLLRIESLKEGILIGKPFLKVNVLFFGGSGYASSMFYSDLFMYIPAILRVIGFGIGTSYHIFVAFIFALCYGSVYYCAYKISLSRYVASIAAILLTLCPYHMDDMLVRGACGEYMAFVFVPFVIYGVYNVVFDNMSRPWVFGLGFTGLILTHPATLFLNLIFTVAVFLIFIKRIVADKKILVRLCVVTVITLLVSAFYWVPMMEQMLSTRFYVSSDTIDMLDAAVPFSELFSQKFPGVGLLLLVCMIPRVFLRRKDYRILEYVDVMLGAAVLFAIGACDVMPWEKLQRFLRFMQFPWRMFIMTSVLLAMADAIIILLFTKEMLAGKIEAVIVGLCAIAVCMAITHQSENATGYYDYGKDYYSYKPFTANVIGAEWLPAAVQDREAIIGLSEVMLQSDGSQVEFERSRGAINAQIDKSADYVDVPFIYYKGYKAKLTDANGQKSSLTVTGEGINGMCRVYTNGQTGSLNVKYSGTLAIHLSAVISLITFAVVVAARVKKRRKING